MADRLSKLNAKIEYEAIHKDRLSKIVAQVEYGAIHKDRLSKIVVQIEYVNTANDFTTAFLNGAVAGTASKNSLGGYIYGAENALEAKPAYLHGNTSTISNIGAYLSGPLLPISSIHSYLSGISTATSSKNVYLTVRAMGRDKSACGAYLAGKDTVSSSTSSYLSGLSRFAESINAFLQGTASAIDEVSAYLIGGATSDSTASVSAYLEGRTEDIVGSVNSAFMRGANNSSCFTSAYLNTNISALSKASAYVSSLTDSVISSKAAYINGLFRSSTVCYLTGNFVSVNYINLKTSDGTLSKRFTVLSQDYGDGTYEKGESITKTVGGGIDHNLGEVYTAWSMIIRVAAEELRPEYGDRNDLEYFYGLNNPKGTPSNIIIFTDHYQHEHRVKMTGNPKKSLITTVVEGNHAIYLYSLQLMMVV